MKKAIAIIILGLLWCSVGFKASADQKFLNCKYENGKSAKWGYDDKIIYQYFEKDLTREFIIKKWGKYNSLEEFKQKSKAPKFVSIYGEMKKTILTNLSLFDIKDVYIFFPEKSFIRVRQQSSETGASGRYTAKDCVESE